MDNMTDEELESLTEFELARLEVEQEIKLVPLDDHQWSRIKTKVFRQIENGDYTVVYSIPPRGVPSTYGDRSDPATTLSIIKRAVIKAKLKQSDLDQFYHDVKHHVISSEVQIVNPP